MSYTVELKNELAHVSVQKRCCRMAELAALAKTCASLNFAGGGKFSLTFATEIEAVASRIMSLCRELYGLTPDMLLLQKTQPRKSNIYQLELAAGDAEQEMLRELGLTFEEDAPTLEQLSQQECCVISALRGAFLGCGMLADPHKQYRLEFVLYSENTADSISALLARVGIESKWATRAEREVIYLKDSESIISLLGSMGAHRMLLEMENVRVIKDVRNNINRRNNCDSANIDKTVNASLRQQEDIRLLLTCGEHIRLSHALKEAAELRLSMPDATLQELADELCISRSAVNNRLRKLAELAEQLRNL